MVERMQQIVSKERITLIRTMAWLQSGILLSRSVHLTRIASKIPGKAKKLSRVRQLERLVDNPHIRVREWYHPVAAGLLQEAARAGGTIRLIIDGSKVGNGHQLLMVSLGYRRRALPLAWTSVSTCLNVCLPTHFRSQFVLYLISLETVGSLVKSTV